MANQFKAGKHWKDINSESLTFGEIVEFLGGKSFVCKEILFCRYETLERKIKNNSPKNSDIIKINDYLKNTRSSALTFLKAIKNSQFNEFVDGRISKHKSK